MVTKKQLAALARGRAIRAANIKRKTTKGKYKKVKRCLKTKKKTNFGWGTIGSLLMKGGKALIGAYPFIKEGLTVNNLFRSQIDDLFGNGNENRVNTRPIKEVLNKIYEDMSARDPQMKHPIFEDIDDLIKVINLIETRQNKWSDETLERNVQEMSTEFRRIVSEYKKLCRR